MSTMVFFGYNVMRPALNGFRGASSESSSFKQWEVIIHPSRYGGEVDKVLSLM